MTEMVSSPELVREITACRLCGSSSLNKVLDLGTHAVSDFYSEIPEDELRVPLILTQCARCGLAQLTHSVNKERLYRNYWYRSGINESMVAALHDVVEDIEHRVSLDSGDAVLDIGANDGTLLDQYPARVLRFGYEPSNIWISAYSRGHTIWHDFYPPSHPHNRAFKAITSIACFYDLDDPSAFVQEICQDLDPEGVWVNQMMDLEAMLFANAFDNICHEHVAYWSLSNFQRLVESHGLLVEEAQRNVTNGGSLRTSMKHTNVDLPSLEEDSKELSQDFFLFRGFSRRVDGLRNQCMAFLEECRYEGKTVIGYGASTKGNTLLQYYGIDSRLLSAIADRNPDKIGKLTAGSHIPIISEKEMRDLRPDYLLILPWHFLVGALEREEDIRKQGTKFIVPLPTFRIV